MARVFENGFETVENSYDGKHRQSRRLQSTYDSVSGRGHRGEEVFVLHGYLDECKFCTIDQELTQSVWRRSSSGPIRSEITPFTGSTNVIGLHSSLHGVKQSPGIWT